MGAVTFGPAPEGFIRSAEGRLYPLANVQARHVLEDQLVRGLVARAEALQEAMSAFKQACFDDISAFRELLAAQYRVTIGGRRDGISLRSYDDTLRVQISVADSLSFGPELEAAKALIDECITDWSEGANAHLRAVVMDAFEVGDGKAPRVDRILGLRRLNIDDDRWQRAMVAIADAVRKGRSKAYIRLHRRDTPDREFQQIVLDVARVG